MDPTVLDVAELSCEIGKRRCLDRVSFAIGPGERVGLFGASGAGKSLILRSLLGLAPHDAQVRGRLRWRTDAERSLADRKSLAALRGGAMALVAQDAGQSLDPVRTIGDQLRELVARHGTALAPRQLLERVGLEEAAGRVRVAQLSGGMAQRAAIAAAIACGPALLLADEPTASLDNVSQQTVLETIDRVCGEAQMGLVLVSHDLALLAERCSRVIVLVDGTVVIDASISAVLDSELAAIAPLLEAADTREATS